MDILVTGATGFVGARLVRHLCGHYPAARIHVLARTSSSHARIQDLEHNITFHEGDVTDTESLKKLAQQVTFTQIYHFANAGVYGGVSASSETLLRVNTLGLLNLLEAFRSTAYEAFVNIGSSSEYGIKNAPMNESDSCNPVSAYGISKLAATHLALLEAVQEGKPISTFRLFSPYGPQDDPSRLISRAISNLHTKEPMRLPHPSAVRDYIYVDDTLPLFVEAAENMTRVQGEIFNVGTGIQTRVVDVLALVAKELDKEEFLSQLPASDGLLSVTESPVWEADMQKTFRTFSWRPSHSLEDGLRKTISWHTAQ